MNTGKLFLWILILVALKISSCKKDVSDVILPEYQHKLNISAFASPDQDDNKIFVSSNTPRFGELRGFDSIGNVSLRVYENSKEISVDTTVEEIKGMGIIMHIRNFKFRYGQAYQLKINSDLGFQLEASSRIPLKRDFGITVDTSYRQTIDEYGQKLINLTAKVSVTDVPGETNYYRLLYMYETHMPGTKTKQYSFKDIIRPVIPRAIAPNSWQTDIMRSDAGMDGQKILLRTIEFQTVYLNFPHQEPASAILRIYLLSTDKPYYDYQMSLINYVPNVSLFTEPSFVYSNVKGGTGVFATYVIDSMIFKIK